LAISITSSSRLFGDFGWTLVFLGPNGIAELDSREAQHAIFGSAE
jgi:hypothetical protein